MSLQVEGLHKASGLELHKPQGAQAVAWGLFYAVSPLTGLLPDVNDFFTFLEKYLHNSLILPTFAA